MITYEENEIEGEIYVAKLTEEGRRFVFVKGGNSKLGQEYLRYTEWVEAGNDPDEFWTQQSDFDTIGETIGETNESI